MKLVEIATERRVTLVMFTVAILLFGFVSLSRLKVNLLPDLSYPTLTVRTELTGAAPLEIESLISKPIEEATGIIKNVRQVRSVSRSGQSDVILEFIWGTDMDLAGVEVREKLDILELPLEASRPLLLRFDPSNEPIMRLALLNESLEAAPGAEQEATLKALRRFAEDRLKNELEAVEGVAATKVSGGLEDEIQILVDQDKLAQLDLAIETVAARLRAENVNLSGGRLEQGSQRFLVRTVNEFQSVGEFADTIVTTFDGSPVYLKDVASVSRGYKEREAITRVNGRESVELAVYKEGDGNTVLVANDVSGRLATIKETLPVEMTLRTVYDQSTFISSAINQVVSAAILGGILAVLVLYMFLRDARATIIIAVAIPICVIGTFVAMYAADITLNIMSLGGIALAIGLLVDNSIVVLENIVRKKEQGLSVLDSARTGTGEVATAITAATLTTVAVFFPMVFVDGVAGQLFRDQALTVTFALAFSLLVALTLIPMLASLAAGPRYRDSVDEGAPSAFTRRFARMIGWILVLFGALGKALYWLLWLPVTAFQRFYGAVKRGYPPLLQWSLEHRMAVLATALAIFAATMSLIPRLGTELIPQLSQGEFILNIRLAPGTPLKDTDRAIELAQAAAAGVEGVEVTYSVAGSGNRLDANPVDVGEHTGTLSVNLGSHASRDEEDEAIARMRSHLRRQAGVQYEFSRPALFSFSTPLEIEVRGYELSDIESVNARILAAMESVDRFTDIKSTVETGNPEIQIIFDHARAAKLGLMVRDIADRVVDSVRGEIATRYTWRDKKIDVLVRSLDPQQASLQEIRDLIVNPTSERPIPLHALAEIKVASGPAEIRRLDQERAAVISANVAYGDLGAAVAEAERILAAIPFPNGVTGAISGQNEEMEQSFRSLQFTLAMAIFLVYMVMASQFESLIHPFVILFTIPLAMVGAVLALYLTGTTLNVVALIGVIMLAGIVVNNAIVLVDLINQLRRAGMDKMQAIREAAEARLRPILMTTLTTALGLLPMAIGFGDGSEIRAPMAITVIGGLAVSTLLTLVVIPVVYSLIDRRAKKLPDVGSERTSHAS